MIVHHGRHDAEERERRRPGLLRDGAGQRRDEDAARLGLPPGIDDRAAPVADDVVVPEPDFRIDGLAHRSQQAQALAAARLHRPFALARDGPDGSGRGVEDRHLVLVDDVPEAPPVRVLGDALEHQAGRAVGQRAVDDVAVARHPAAVGGAPELVVFLDVEDQLVRERGVDHVSAGRVHHALGLSGRAAGVEDEERVLGVHLLRLAFGGNVAHQVVPPLVASLAERHFLAGALEHHHRLHARAFLERFVGGLLERNDAPAAIAAVGGDHHFAAAVLDAVLERLGGEAAEHHAVDRADARASEHRDGKLGHHRQVDGDAIALLDA